MKFSSQTPAASPDRSGFWSWPGLLEELSRVCFYLVHLTWLVPWAFGLLRYNQPGSEVLVFILLLAVTWGADVLARAMSSYRLKLKVRRVVLGTYIFVALVVILGAWGAFSESLAGGAGTKNLMRSILEFTSFNTAVPGEFVIAVFVLLNILHGVRQAQEFIGPPSFVTSMLWGVLGFVSYGVVISRVNGTNPALWFYLFIAAMVTGLYLYRVSGYLGRSKSEQRIASHRWRIGMLAIVFLFLWLSGLGSAVVGEYLKELRSFFGAVALNVMYVVSLPFLGILALFEAALQPYIGKITIPEPPPLFRIIKLPEMPANPAPDELDALLNMIGSAVKPFVLWAILIVVTMIILRFALFSKTPQTSVADYYESLLETEDIPKLITKNLRSQVTALLGRLARSGENRRRLHAAARIRQIYSAWLSICAENGIPRLDAQTPAEHGEIAAGVFPLLRSDIFLLVNAYHRVRYGEYPELPDELKVVEQAWTRLRRA